MAKDKPVSLSDLEKWSSQIRVSRDGKVFTPGELAEMTIGDLACCSIANISGQPESRINLHLTETQFEISGGDAFKLI